MNLPAGAGLNGNGKKWLGAAAAGAAIAGLATGLVTLDLPPWAVEMTKLWGPGFLMIVGVFGGIVYFVPRDTLPRFVVSQENVAVSMAGIKDQLQIMSGQAGQLHEIKEMLSEIQTTQGVHGDRLKTIETRIGDERRRTDDS